MSVIVLTEAMAKPGRIGEVEKFFAAPLPEACAREGCQRVNLNIGDDERSFVLVGIWDAKESHQQALAWRKSRSDETARFIGKLEQPPVNHYFERLEI